MFIYCSMSFEAPRSHTLGPGWDEDDVALLKEMAELGMELARNVVAEVREAKAAAEAGVGVCGTPDEPALRSPLPLRRERWTGRVGVRAGEGLLLFAFAP